MTHQYELMVILDPEIDERTVAPSLDKFLNVIRNDGGTIDNVDIWGRRRLAYEIAKKSEGIYAVVNFTANSDATIELDRQLKLSEAVLRTKVLRAEVAMARAVTVKAEDEQRAARKAAAAAKNPKAAAAAEKAAAEKATAEKAAADKATAEKPAEKPAKAEPAAEAPEAPAVEAEKPAKAAAKPKAAKADAEAPAADAADTADEA